MKIGYFANSYLVPKNSMLKILIPLALIFFSQVHADVTSPVTEAAEFIDDSYSDPATDGSGAAKTNSEVSVDSSQPSVSSTAWKTIEYAPADQKHFSDEKFVFDESNQKFYFDTIENKSILLVFWATWCTYCVDEMPSLDILKKDFKNLPLEILAVSQDYKGIEAVQKFYQDNNIRQLKILHDYKFQLFSSLNLSSLPYAILIDPNKKIVLNFEGPVQWHNDDVRAKILSYIPGNPVMPYNSYKKDFFKSPVKNKDNSSKDNTTDSGTKDDSK